VRDAPNGRVGLREYHLDLADIIITDIVMPDKEGLETIRELRSLHPKARIIAISGGGAGRANQYLEMAKRLGATRTLAKPFSGDEILALIDEVLSEKTGSPES
jgi:YesN/AraC family two-component response regulator